MGNSLVNLGNYALDLCVFCVTNSCNPLYATLANPTGEDDLTIDTHNVVWYQVELYILSFLCNY